MDAGAFGCRLGPKEAYRFAKGQEVVASMGERVRLSRLPDFQSASDTGDDVIEGGWELRAGDLRPAGMRNQSLGAQQINEAMGQVADGAQQTQTALREFNLATVHLRQSVESLNQEVAQFTV
jgi:methyl-accepting chemotaxis protein